MPRFVEQAAAQGIPLVVASTGWGAAGEAAIERAAVRVPVLVAANLARGVAILGRLAAEAARLCGAQADIEIIETHHRHKRDAPSGTALRLAETIARACGEERPVGCGRSAARRPGEIGVHAVRAGDVVGEHTVVFAFGSQRLELVHRVHDRAVFAAGALRAARFVAACGRPGRYGPEDALGA